MLSSHQLNSLICVILSSQSKFLNCFPEEKKYNEYLVLCYIYLTCLVPYRGGYRIPRRRGRQPSGGAPTYNFAKFSEEMHENEKILVHRGAYTGDAPLRSATAIDIGEKHTITSRLPKGRKRYIRCLWLITKLKIILLKFNF